MLVVIQLVVVAAVLSDHTSTFAQQQLTTDDTSIQDVIAKFEKLEAQVHQLQTNDVVQQNLIERLQEEVDRVNEKYAVQEIIIQSLLKGKENKKDDDVNKRTAINLFSSADSRLYSMPRSCNEAKSLDPTLSSGYYYVDPDGTNIGDAPIYVYCDMTTGSTMVSHDSEATIDVGNCANAGCYSKQIKYNATLRQMVALSEISTTCQQSIRYDCFVAPFEFNGVQESWWNDRNNVPRYFWSGVNTNQHTCQCGIDNNCVDPSFKCNCDSVAALQLVDNGILTDKNLLPVTRLNFGRTPAGSNGRHTLGKFQCSGRAAVQGKPTSCRQLFQIGHELNGFYMVQGDKRIETVYCDFTQSPEAYETRIGYNDIKSSSVYFYVKKTASFGILNTPIPFEIELLNIGGAMNLATGVFTAPRPGRYLFSLSGIVNVPDTRVDIHLNGDIKGTSYGTTSLGTHSLDSIMDLKVGDIVTLVLRSGSIYDSGLYTHFVGLILEEDLIF